MHLTGIVFFLFFFFKFFIFFCEGGIKGPQSIFSAMLCRR